MQSGDQVSIKPVDNLTTNHVDNSPIEPVSTCCNPNHVDNSPIEPVSTHCSMETSQILTRCCNTDMCPNCARCVCTSYNCDRCLDTCCTTCECQGTDECDCDSDGSEDDGDSDGSKDNVNEDGNGSNDDDDDSEGSDEFEDIDGSNDSKVIEDIIKVHNLYSRMKHNRETEDYNDMLEVNDFIGEKIHDELLNTYKPDDGSNRVYHLLDAIRIINRIRALIIQERDIVKRRGWFDLWAKFRSLPKRVFSVKLFQTLTVIGFTLITVKLLR